MKNDSEFYNGVSVYVRRAWDVKMPVGWSISERYIFDYELLYVKEGKLRVKYDDKVYDGEVGDLFFIKPYVIHSIESVGKDRVRQPHIHFDFFYDELSESLPVPLSMPNEGDAPRRKYPEKTPLDSIPPKISLKDPFRVDLLIQNIILEKENGNPFSILRQKSLMLELLWIIMNNQYMLKENKLLRGDILAVIQEANRYMQQYCDRNLTNGEISAHVGYSTNYFVGLYKSVNKLSPIDYHEKLRVEKAKVLISSTSLNMSQISEELGFNDLYSFSRFFKRKVGQSPLEYRLGLKN